MPSHKHTQREKKNKLGKTQVHTSLSLQILIVFHLRRETTQACETIKWTATDANINMKWKK